jgi:hypothetical protein
MNATLHRSKNRAEIGEEAELVSVAFFATWLLLGVESEAFQLKFAS